MRETVADSNENLGLSAVGSGTKRPTVAQLLEIYHDKLADYKEKCLKYGDDYAITNDSFESLLIAWARLQDYDAYTCTGWVLR